MTTVAAKVLSAATINEEVVEFLADLQSLKVDINQARNGAIGKDKKHLRFVGERVERALQELRRINIPVDET